MSRSAVAVFLGGLVFALALPSAGRAHIVLADNHDRTIVVTLGADAKTGEATVRVDYRLEVNETTAILTDLAAIKGQLNLSEFRQQRERFFQEFARCYAPILARNLDARLDGQALTFSCTKSAHRLNDESGRVLGHLRCDFVFRARAKLKPAARHKLVFKEGNYQEVDKGLLLLSFVAAKPVQVVEKTVPDAALQAKPAFDIQPGDEEKLRTVKATFTLPGPAGKAPATSGPRKTTQPAVVAKAVPAREPVSERPTEDDDHAGLVALVLHSQHGLLLMLVIAAGIGAIHALTPGHGKTLVAAYLVGEHGTVWHALLLGLVTTATHTGVVLVIAVALNLFFPEGLSADKRQGLQQGLGLAGGLLVACLGFWLLLRRLSGRADHFHLGGHGHHHHHHGPAHDHHHGHDHCHDEHGHVHPLPAGSRPVGWWGLVVLGMSGGIVPCWDAIALLVWAVATNLLWLAVPVLLAFSAGLAGVLVVIGILVVKARGFAGSRWGESRFFRALPLFSAAAVTLLGLWLCYYSVNSAAPDDHAPARPQTKAVQSR